MSNFTVTATDKKLLDLLATDAKLTHDQLAAMLGVAEAEYLNVSPCWKRKALSKAIKP